MRLKLPNLRLALVKRRLRQRGLVIVPGNEMAIRIRFADGSNPEFELGPPGAELSCYVPEGLPWTQRYYAQGEGQVEIAGRTWGFYRNAPGTLDVILYHGEIDVEHALAFIRAVAGRVAGKGRPYELVIAGQRIDYAMKLPPRQDAMKRGSF